MKNYKKVLSLSLSVCIIFGQVGFVAAEDVNNETTEIQYIIKYNPQTLMQNGDPSQGGSSGSGLTVEQVIENNLSDVYNVSVVDELSKITETQGTMLVSMTSSDTSVTSSELNNIDGVYYAEPNYRIHKLSNDPGYSNQWAINNSNEYGINIGIAQSIAQTTDECLIAVLDTGIDIYHQDLSANIFTNSGETANGADSDSNGYIDDIHGWDFTTFQNLSVNGDNTVYDNAQTDSHGTHVAGIIAAAVNNIGIEGVAPNSKILPVKILSDDDGTVFNAIKGIEYAEMMGAKIANCSWGNNHYSQFLSDTIKNSNMLFVCAAGNDSANMEVTPTYPAAFNLDNIISVAANDENGEIASFSNYGKGVNISAPGKNIYSTLPENSYGNLDGTSMAAPFVTGSAALLLQSDTSVTAREIKDRLENTVTKVNALDEKTDWGGILNAYNLVLTTVKPTDYSVGNYGAKSVIANNDIYTIGGYNGTDYSSSVMKFDSVNKIWQKTTDLPVAVADCSVAVSDNKIFVIGGINENPTGNVQIYNLNNNTWQSGVSMPKAIYAAAYSQIGSSLYIFGGLSVSGYLNTVYRYDLINNTWEEKNNMELRTAYSSALTINNTIYLLGGCNEYGCLDSIFTYDIANDKLNYFSRMSEKRKNFATVAYDNEIFIFGGSNSFNSQGVNMLYEYNSAVGTYIESVIDTVEVLDTTTKLCSIADNLEKPEMGLSAINYFDNIYLLGGWSGAYEKSVIRYFGAAIPKNIQFKSSENILKIKWNSISDATGYNIEIDGQVYESISNTYQLSASDNIEHKIRVRAKKNNQQSLWSDYIYYYLNSTMLDAKQIAVNSTSTDKLYKTGQTKWYKLNNLVAGKLSVSLNNIPENCNYLVQVCNTSGEVIATGANLDGIQMINNLVLNPFAYYIKVSSVYGGNDTNAYTLNCSFVATSSETLPDRVRSAFLKPSALDDLSADGELKDLSEYEGEDKPPVNVVTNENDETISSDGSGAAFGSEALPEEENMERDIQGQSLSLMSVQGSNVETGSIANQGSYSDKYVTVPSNLSMSSSDKLKLVVLVVPDNSSDVFELEWRGSNTNYNNFWQLWHGNNEYYLTALLSRNYRGTRFSYRIKLNYKSTGSTGGYTIKTYMIVDNSSSEDFISATGNDNPSTADTLSVGTNSSATYTGKLDHEYDYDFYKISVSNNQKLSAYLVSPDNKWYQVDILDHMGSSTNYTSSQYMDGHLGDYGNARASIQTTSSRNYMILVRPFLDGISADSTYTLKIFRYNVSNIGELEVNDSAKQADTKITAFTNSYLGGTNNIASPISFKIDSPADIDYYAVTMAVGDKLSIQMEMPASYNDSVYKYRIGVEDSDWIHTYNNPDSSKSKYATYVAQTAGTHYVFVKSETGQYNYNITGTLRITKTLAANMDSTEVKTQNLPLYGECATTNDFIFTTMFGLFGSEFGIRGYTELEANSQLISNFDNELDVDWYKFTNGTASKTAAITINGSNSMNSAAGIIVLDSNYTLLTSGVSGNAYTFAPNETYYIAAYVDDNKYSTIMSNRNYSISVDLSELRSDLVFNPLDWGTFVYDNDPEFLTDDDMADYDLGNRLLMSADGLSGVVDFQSSHSAKPYMLEGGRNISLDILLYNPTDKPVTVEVERIGYQSPRENNLAHGEVDWSATNWVCLQAWADFLQFNYNDEMLIGDLKKNYKDYKFKYVQNKLPNNGVYKINPGETVWMLGESAALTMKKEVWSPFNIVSRLKIHDDGQINLGFAAFRNRSKVYSPESSRLIYDVATQRSYPAEYAICSHECGCVDKSKCPHICVKEHDVNGKPKGIANSAAEVETHTIWSINDNTEYFTPTLYNYANPTGFTIGGTENDYWITNFNPNADAYNQYNVGVESDILPLEFNEKDAQGNVINRWMFDCRHTDPGSGNNMFGGNPPVSNAMPLGNYGVVERYYVDITNTTTTSKTITYRLNTSSHAIITFKDGDNGWVRRIKLGELREDNESVEHFLNRQIKDIFSINVHAGDTKQLIIEVILPNADAGGYKHQLVSE